MFVSFRDTKHLLRKPSSVERLCTNGARYFKGTQDSVRMCGLSFIYSPFTSYSVPPPPFRWFLALL
jgi:hypothetical protein